MPKSRIKTGLKKVRSALRRISPWKPHQVVICGLPRSGTSLLYNMMSQSLPGFHYDEFEVRCVKYVKDRRNTLSKRPLDVFEIADLVQQVQDEKRITVIMLHRDIRDVITSRHPRVPEDYFIGYDYSYRTDLPTGPAPTRPGVKGFCEAMKQVESMPNIEVHIIRYEDIVEYPDAVGEQVAVWLGVCLRQPFSSFHLTPEQLPYRYDGIVGNAASFIREHRSPEKSRIGKWKLPEHHDRIVESFTMNPQLNDILIEWGYENNTCWLESFQRNSIIASYGLISLVLTLIL
jgi:hypothetical protein